MLAAGQLKLLHAILTLSVTIDRRTCINKKYYYRSFFMATLLAKPTSALSRNSTVGKVCRKRATGNFGHRNRVATNVFHCQGRLLVLLSLSRSAKELSVTAVPHCDRRKTRVQDRPINACLDGTVRGYNA